MKIRATRSDATIRARERGRGRAFDGANDRRDAARRNVDNDDERDAQSQSSRPPYRAPRRSHRSNSRVYFHASDHTGSHRSMGTFPCLFRMDLSAPLWRRKLTISTCPRMAAQCNAVLSPMSSASTSAPFSTRYLTVWKWPLCAARQRAISHQTRLLQVGALVDEEIAHGGVAVARGEEHGRVAAVVRLVERAPSFMCSLTQS